jgi:hypothetical protein
MRGPSLGQIGSLALACLDSLARMFRVVFVVRRSDVEYPNKTSERDAELGED